MLPRNRTLNIKSGDLWIALLPVIVFIAGEWFMSTFGFYRVTPFPDTEFDAAAEAGGRYTVYGMFFLFAAVCIGVTAVFFLDVNSLFNRASRRRLFAIVAGLGAIVLIVVVLGPWIWSSPKTYWFAGKNLFDHLFQHAKIEWCCIAGNDFAGTLQIVAESCREPFSVGQAFNWLLKIANILIAIAAASAIVGAVSCLGEPPAQARPIFEDQCDRLNHYLYLGAALMVCGMLLILSWLHWPDFYFTPENKSYATLVNGLTIYYGVNYSLIVVAYYAPVALVLSERQAKRTQSANAAKLSRSGPAGKQHPGIAGTFKVAFALLSPFLTGVLPTLITALSGGIDTP
ncbi:MAG TPA: hypothetical protein VNJ31_00245 [Methyloceanibacter sp.]|nr:hypothetical protein [Methyloceanibacter sp.]